LFSIRSLVKGERYDVGSLWKEIAVRLLADGCEHRTGHHEEDGCWPALDSP
jgi:hypothetical protein